MNSYNKSNDYNKLSQANELEDTKSEDMPQMDTFSIKECQQGPTAMKQQIIKRQFCEIFSYLNNGQKLKDHSRREIYEKKLREFPLETGEIVLFGNTNAGKSSLLNCMLGMQLLNTSSSPETSFFWTVKISTQRRRNYECEVNLIKKKHLSIDMEFEYTRQNGKPVLSHTVSREFSSMKDLQLYITKLSKSNIQDPTFDLDVYSIQKVELTLPQDCVKDAFCNPDFRLVDLPGLEDSNFEHEIRDYIQFFNYKQFPVFVLDLSTSTINLVQYNIIKERFGQKRQKIFVVFTKFTSFKLLNLNEIKKHKDNPTELELINELQIKLQQIALEFRDEFNKADIQFFVYDPQEPNLYINSDLTLRTGISNFDYYKISKGEIQFIDSLKKHTNSLNLNISQKLAYSLLQDLDDIFYLKQESFKGERVLSQIQDQITMKAAELQFKYKNEFSARIQKHIDEDLSSIIDYILVNLLKEDKKKTKVRILRHKFQKKITQRLTERVVKELEDFVVHEQVENIQGFSDDLIRYLNDIYNQGEVVAVKMAEKGINCQIDSNVRQAINFGTTSGLIVAVAFSPNVIQISSAATSGTLGALGLQFAGTVGLSLGIFALVGSFVLMFWRRKKVAKKIKRIFLEQIQQAYIVEKLKVNFDEQIESKKDEIKEGCKEKLMLVPEERKMDFYLRLVHGIDQIQFHNKMQKFRDFLDQVYTDQPSEYCF